MATKKILRLISLGMLIAAVIFVFCALSCPTLGHTVHIGTHTFGSQAMAICYAIYAMIMVVLFIVSFLINKKK